MSKEMKINNLLNGIIEYCLSHWRKHVRLRVTIVVSMPTTHDIVGRWWKQWIWNYGNHLRTNKWCQLTHAYPMPYKICKWAYWVTWNTACFLFLFCLQKIERKGCTGKKRQKTTSREHIKTTIGWITLTILDHSGNNGMYIIPHVIGAVWEIVPMSVRERERTKERSKNSCEIGR